MRSIRFSPKATIYALARTKRSKISSSPREEGRERSTNLDENLIWLGNRLVDLSDVESRGRSFVSLDLHSSPGEKRKEGKEVSSEESERGS